MLVSNPNKNKPDAWNAISLPFLGAKLCLHPFLYLENSLVNLFLRLEQTQKIYKDMRNWHYSYKTLKNQKVGEKKYPSWCIVVGQGNPTLGPE